MVQLFRATPNNSAALINSLPTPGVSLPLKNIKRDALGHTQRCSEEGNVEDKVGDRSMDI